MLSRELTKLKMTTSTTPRSEGQLANRVTFEIEINKKLLALAQLLLQIEK